MIQIAPILIKIDTLDLLTAEQEETVLRWTLQECKTFQGNQSVLEQMAKELIVLLREGIKRTVTGEALELLTTNSPIRVERLQLPIDPEHEPPKTEEGEP